MAEAAARCPTCKRGGFVAKVKTKDKEQEYRAYPGLNNQIWYVDGPAVEKEDSTPVVYATCVGMGLRAEKKAMLIVRALVAYAAIEGAAS